jgi:hypothetical protein
MECGKRQGNEGRNTTYEKGGGGGAEDDVAKTENQESRKPRSAEAARDRGRQHERVLAFQADDGCDWKWRR